MFKIAIPGRDLSPVQHADNAMPIPRATLPMTLCTGNTWAFENTTNRRPLRWFVACDAIAHLAAMQAKRCRGSNAARVVPA